MELDFQDVENCFEIIDKAMGKRKTFWFCCGIDIYTRRDGSNERVFRIKWPERNSKYPTHEEYKKAERKARNIIKSGYYAKMPNEYVWQTQLFTYSPDGLKAALRFKDAIQPKIDEYNGRD